MASKYLLGTTPGGISLLTNETPIRGQLKSLVAGTGMSISDSNGLLTIGANSDLASSAQNQPALKLPKFRAKLAGTKAGLNNTRVLCLGNSITAGAYSNGVVPASGDWCSGGWVNQLAKMFNAQGINAHSDSFMGFSIVARDGRMTFPSPWLATVGTIGGHYVASGGAGTSVMTYTPENPVDTFKVWYLTIPTAGVLACNINGGTDVTVDQNTAISLGNLTVTGNLGINTLNMRRTSGGNAFVCGIESWNSTQSSVQFINAGWSGATTNDWLSQATAYSPGNFASLAADLTIISLNINDMLPSNGISVATMKTNLQNIITRALTTGDVLLIAENPVEVATTISLANQTLYVNAVKELAVTNNLPLVNIFDRWVSYEYSNPLGYYAVGAYPINLHPYPIGYQDYATAVFDFLHPSRGNGTNDAIATPLQFTVKNVNFNSANTDTPIVIRLPAGITRYKAPTIRISGASATITTATCGVFTAAAAGGTAVITNPTTITVSSATESSNNNMQNITPTNNDTMSYNNTTLYFRVITAQGSAATANVTIIIEPLS